LPSWNERPAKQAIVAFVAETTREGGVGFVPVAERIAVFDNDEWTAAGTGPRFMGIVHHTDAEREWAYDRHSHIGKLDKALDEALAKGWTVVDMKKDW
jgi:hypothetical protein